MAEPCRYNLTCVVLLLKKTLESGVDLELDFEREGFRAIIAV